MKFKTPVLVLAAALAGYAGGMYFPVIASSPVRFIPHRAPDKAYLGKYEGEKGPFVINEPGREVIMEDHNWKIGKNGTEYQTEATGYYSYKDANGRFRHKAFLLRDSTDYDTVHSYQVPTSRLPIADADKLPDSLYISSLEEDGIFGAPVWERIRTSALPFRFRANNREYTVTNRKISKGLEGNPYTTIASGIVHRLTGSDTLPGTFEIKEDRYITQ